MLIGAHSTSHPIHNNPQTMFFHINYVLNRLILFYPDIPVDP